jgi:type III restriction enzyme
MLEGALFSLYSDYERRFNEWAALSGSTEQQTPPVMIIVCQNVAISKQVFDWIAGQEKVAPDGTVTLQKGKLALFDNTIEAVNRGREWKAMPNSIIVDSYQLEREDAELDSAFREAAAHLIEDFKRQWALRNPGLDPDKEVKGGAILREAMNTVGKAGKLGEGIRCVVSVSMLTEGWDASTVTHILGVRAFGTQLLCEQVVGRALRRISYAPNEEGMYEPEYAEVYGIPFNFIRSSAQGKPAIPKPIYKVRTIEDRIDKLIRFPRVKDYATDWPREQLHATWDDRTRMALSPDDVGGTEVELDPFVGEGKVVTTENLSKERLQTVAYTLARRTLEDHYTDSEGGVPVHLYPELVKIARDWLNTQLDVRGGAFPQLLLISGLAHRAAEKIQVGLRKSQVGAARVVPVLRKEGGIGSTSGVAFETTKRVRETKSSHLNYAVLDSKWEGKMAEELDSEPRVLSWVKNFGLDFSIPYRYEGAHGQYFPDFIVLLDDGNGKEDPLHLIVEVKGVPDDRTNAKAAAAETQWVPAVNAWGELGRWRYLEVVDPWDGIELIRALGGAQDSLKERRVARG